MSTSTEKDNGRIEEFVKRRKKSPTNGRAKRVRKEPESESEGESSDSSLTQVENEVLTYFSQDEDKGEGWAKYRDVLQQVTECPTVERVVKLLEAKGLLKKKGKGYKTVRVTGRGQRERDESVGLTHPYPKSPQEAERMLQNIEDSPITIREILVYKAFRKLDEERQKQARFPRIDREEMAKLSLGQKSSGSGWRLAVLEGVNLVEAYTDLSKRTITYGPSRVLSDDDILDLFSHRSAKFRSVLHDNLQRIDLGRLPTDREMEEVKEVKKSSTQSEKGRGAKKEIREYEKALRKSGGSSLASREMVGEWADEVLVPKGKSNTDTLWESFQRWMHEREGVTPYNKKAFAIMFGKFAGQDWNDFKSLGDERWIATPKASYSEEEKEEDTDTEEQENGQVKTAEVEATMTSTAKSEAEEEEENTEKGNTDPVESEEGEVPEQIKKELKNRADITEHVKEVALSHVQMMDKEELKDKIEEGGPDEELTLKIDLTPYIDSIFK